MRIAALALAAGLLLTSGCSGTESVQQARSKVDVFHQHLDKADYEAIWQTTSDDIRKTGSKDQFVAILAAVHTKLGKVKETKQIGWRANATPAAALPN